MRKRNNAVACAGDAIFLFGMPRSGEARYGELSAQARAIHNLRFSRICIASVKRRAAMVRTSRVSEHYALMAAAGEFTQ